MKKQHFIFKIAVKPYLLGSDDAENANEGIFQRKRLTNSNIILDRFT